MTALDCYTPTVPAGMVRVVAPTALGGRYGYVSIIRFVNAYSVTLSNDPRGYAGGYHDRLVVTQTLTLGRAAAAFNRCAGTP